jgi:GNAT superfamily N-acetyltransferase
MQLRYATLADAPALAQLITQLGYPTNLDQMRARLCPLLSDPVYHTIVAEIDGAVVGMIGLRIDRGHEYDGVQGRIVALVADSKFRGTGVGKALVREAERWSRERGAHKIMVNTANHRTHTHEFYRRLGFEMTGLRFVKALRELSS